MRSLIRSVAALTLFSASPTFAQTTADPMIEDLKCIAVVSVAGEDGKGDVKEGIASLFTYFVGRMHGRDPSVDVAQLFRDNVAMLDVLDIKAEAPRCLAEMDKATKAISAIGG
jgi:hypothetical protein